MRKTITMMGVEVPHLHQDHQTVAEVEYDLMSNFLSELFIKSDEIDVKITYDHFNRRYDMTEVLEVGDISATRALTKMEDRPETLWEAIQMLQTLEWAI